jgi:hypothetical protein
MQLLLTAAFIFILTGCTAVAVKPMPGPHGRDSIHLTCRDDKDCLTEANRQCPRGYNLESSMFNSREKQFVFLVTCDTKNERD